MLDAIRRWFDPEEEFFPLQMFFTGAILLILAFLGCFVWCVASIDPDAIATSNTKTLASGGVLVGHLPDGREVRVYEIDQPGQRPHYLYVSGNATTSISTHTTGGKHPRSVDTVVAELPE